MRQTVRGERFFLYFPWAILVFVLISFGGKAAFDTANLPPLTPYHHLHAVAMLSWFGLFALQPTLIHLGKIPTHRLLGRLSPIIVVAFLVSSTVMTGMNWRRLGDPMIVTANAINTLAFVLLYAAAIAWRLRAAAHKRLMLYATLGLIGPAAGRIPETLDLHTLLTLPILLALMLTPLIRDWRARGRPHPAAWIGFGALFAANLAAGFVAGAPGWIAMLNSALGPQGSG